MPLAEIRRKRE